jgi:hypothetical protein
MWTVRTCVSDKVVPCEGQVLWVLVGERVGPHGSGLGVIMGTEKGRVQGRAGKVRI